MLHFISTLAQPEMVGVNPEVAHETMAGLSMAHGVAQAMEAGKLFHIDLNAQKIGRYDQDLRFGSEDLKGAFLLVRLLEGTGGGEPYGGPLHFDAHADLRDAYEGFTWSHASILRNVLERIEGVAQVLQVGIRDFSEEERDYTRASDGRVRVLHDL